jgi:hypothetical protein
MYYKELFLITVTTPLKEMLDPTMTLLQAKFVPCVHMHFKWLDDGFTDTFLRDEIYSKKTTSDAASILASKYRYFITLEWYFLRDAVIVEELDGSMGHCDRGSKATLTKIGHRMGDQKCYYLYLLYVTLSRFGTGCICNRYRSQSQYSLFSLVMFTYKYERQDIIQIALKRLPGGGERLKKKVSPIKTHWARVMGRFPYV